MVQELLIGLSFAGAASYLGRTAWRQFAAKDRGCAKGCGSCGAIDFNKIQQQIEARAQAPAAGKRVS